MVTKKRAETTPDSHTFCGQLTATKSTSDFEFLVILVGWSISCLIFRLLNSDLSCLQSESLRWLDIKQQLKSPKRSISLPSAEAVSKIPFSLNISWYHSTYSILVISLVFSALISMPKAAEVHTSTIFHHYIHLPPSDIVVNFRLSVTDKEPVKCFAKHKLFARWQS